MNIKPIAGIVLVASTLLATAGCASSTPADAEEPGAAPAGGSTGCAVDAAAEEITEEAAAHITELCEAASAAGEDELNVISGLPDDMKTTFDAFTARFGIKINITNEIDPALTADLQGQVQSGNHVTDVLHNPNGQKYVDFAEPYHVESLQIPEELEASAAELQDPEDLYSSPLIGFFGLGTFLPRAGELQPTKWSDLAEPEYAGLVGMGDPTVPGPNQDAPMYLTLNGALDEQQVAGVFENADGNVKGTYGDAVAGLMQGQFAFLFGAPSSAVYLASKQGAPVKFSLMSEDNYVVTHKHLLIKDAPHPNAAKLYLEWLNTLEAGKAVSKAGLTPLNTNAAAETEKDQPWTNWKNANLTEIIPAADIDAGRQETVAKFKQMLGK
ncbi:extracellular solute-binding protein [Microbacterium sp. NPDC096154]|uniref:ABC transporter substrate-binding protein n=1 Tax=Microbacterium sp. NPDC096154 TaxID=3155549 RepID=UPI00332EF00D